MKTLVSELGGTPLNIISRGDCTSRRAVALNPSFFGVSPKFTQSQKSTFSQMLEALDGRLITSEYLERISDVSQMPQVLATYYLGQADPQVLDARDADLLIVDNYAEMNFSMWIPNHGGPKFWMHPKYLRDSPSFYERHSELGKPTFAQSISDAASFIEALRRQAPLLPVLVLNQQVDFYPKLADRAKDFQEFGKELAGKVPLVFPAPVLTKEQLDLADLNSSGPGNTLHFQADTYLKMLEGAQDLGLATAIAARRELRTSSDESFIRVPQEDGNANLKADETQSAQQSDTDALLEINLNLDFHPEVFCSEGCERILTSVSKTFANYFVFDPESAGKVKPRFTPMVLNLEDYGDVSDWVAARPATYRHQIKKSEVAGFYVKPFHIKNYTVDAYEINTSKEVRSGGEIRSNLTKSIEDLGGVPTAELPLGKIKCLRHWRQTFGVFERRDGYMQGEITTDQKLVAYLSAVRYGELVVFAQLLGHGDYLDKGVVNFLIQEFMAGAISEPWGKRSGLKYVMYGGAQNGGEGLFNFKRRSGLTPSCVNLSKQPGYPLAE